MCRCKLKHTLAFFQFRRSLDETDNAQIEESFRQLRDHWVMVLKMVVEKIGDDESYAAKEEDSLPINYE